MKLVIVESPTKAKTLSKILNDTYVIKASMGHICDLPKSGLGIDVEHDFAPEYVVSDKTKKTLRDLKKSAKDSKVIILATDPDREGEAIAWHLTRLLVSKDKQHPYSFERVVFHELTENAINDAFEHSGKLDLNLVNAQQARRILDRLVGYKLSPLLWKKVRYGLSAGRVQSVVVRLIVERERERYAFKPEEYWDINGLFSTSSNEEFSASLVKKDGKKLEVKNEDEARKIEVSLKNNNFNIKKIERTERKRAPNPPFKTSTLQRSASNMYGMSAQKTMRAAQKLFEKGLITYHRTDSLNLSKAFIDSARANIASNYGSEYVPEKPNFYKTKSKGAQEAHEAIRPTDLSNDSVKFKVPDEKKIYTLIYKKALESQMPPAIYDNTAVVVESETGYEFRANGSIIKFDGWLAVGKKLGIQGSGNDLLELPDIHEGDSTDLKTLDLKQKFTQPPTRYSDASLIKKLEEMEIGRPSTYAPTLTTVKSRGYVEKEGKSYKPKDVAFVVTDLLVEHFNNIVDYDFTAKMEDTLDEIAEDKKKWVPVIKKFYDSFEKTLVEKEDELSKHVITNLGDVGEECPECGSPLIFKLGKYGKFISCSNYPECKYARPLDEDKVVDDNGEEVKDFGKCDKCEDGYFVLKKGRFGKFLACSNYPKCKTTKPFLEKIGMKCPKCESGDIVMKKAKGRTFYGCSNYPDCDYSSWKNPNQR